MKPGPAISVLLMMFLSMSRFESISEANSLGFLLSYFDRIIAAFEERSP